MGEYPSMPSIRVSRYFISISLFSHFRRVKYMANTMDMSVEKFNSNCKKN